MKYQSKFISSPSCKPISGGLGEFGERILRNTSPMMRGEDVREVQLRVAARPDGIFGPQTEAKVKAYQQTAGLPATGVVDGRTWDSLSTIALPGQTGSMHFNRMLPWIAGGIAALGVGAILATRTN